MHPIAFREIHTYYPSAARIAECRCSGTTERAKAVVDLLEAGSMLRAILSLAICLPVSWAGCGIYQNGTMKMPLGFDSPGPLLKVCSMYMRPACCTALARNPQFDLEGGDNPCPQFSQGDDVCCSTTQIKALRTNFLLLDVTFGSPDNGGCPACYANLAHAWCEQTCSPHQELFISHPQVTQKKGVIFEHMVLEYDLAMNRDFACGVFDSCSNTQTVVQSGFNAEGLWNFQGQSPGVVTTQQVYINIHYDDAPPPAVIGGLLQSCNSYERSLAYGANASVSGNTSCPCATCSETCIAPAGGASGKGSAAEVTELTKSLYSTWSGFLWLPVAIFYSVLLLISAMLTTYNHCFKSSSSSQVQGASAGGREPLLQGGHGGDSLHPVRHHMGINDNGTE